MTRLANIDADIRIIPIFPLGHISVPTGNDTFGFSLRLNDVQHQTVNRHRIGAEHHLFWVEDKTGVHGEWASMPDAAQTIHYLQNSARSDRFDGGESPNKRVGMCLSKPMRTVHIREASVSDVLEAPRDSGRSVILHGGHIDDLGKLRDHRHHFRAGVVFSEEVYFHIGRRIVVPNTPASSLGAVDLNPFGQAQTVVHLFQTLGKTIIDTNLARLEAKFREVAHNLCDDFGRRDNSRPTYTVHFDPNNIGRSDKSLPGAETRGLAG